jgi:hypothetical protein
MKISASALVFFFCHCGYTRHDEPSHYYSFQNTISDPLRFARGIQMVTHWNLRFHRPGLSKTTENGNAS